MRVRKSKKLRRVSISAIAFTGLVAASLLCVAALVAGGLYLISAFELGRELTLLINRKPDELATLTANYESHLLFGMFSTAIGAGQIVVCIFSYVLFDRLSELH